MQMYIFQYRIAGRKIRRISCATIGRAAELVQKMMRDGERAFITCAHSETALSLRRDGDMFIIKPFNVALD